MQKRLAFLLTCILAAALLSGCGGKAAASGMPGGAAARTAVESSELQFTAPASGDTIAVIDTTSGEIRVVLYPQYAPQACENFITLAQQGYYNGLSVSRISAGLCVEAGLADDGTSTTIWGGNAYSPETTDLLHHYSGAFCAPIDASGQCSSMFYFMQTPQASPDDELIQKITDAGYRADVISAYQAAGGAPYLDYTDTVFGQVYSGMDIVDTIAQAEVDDDGKPTSDIIISSIKIGTY